MGAAHANSPKTTAFSGFSAGARAPAPSRIPSEVPSMKAWRPLLLLLLSVVTGCELTSTPDDRVVGGVNLTELFTPATPAEREAVLDDWASRNPIAEDVRTVHQASATLGGSPATVRVLSHEVGGVTHFGAVVAPDGAAPASLPILVYLHGGDSGVSVDGEVLFIMQFLTSLADRFVIVVPSFRDESVRFAGQSWRSDGPPSPWDYDVDDALALLDAAIATTPAADPTRIATMGMSRGGAVALLMAARDERIDRVVDFFGPTDFFGEFVQDVTEELLNGRPRDLPGLEYMNATYLEPLRDGEMAPAVVRLALARRSAALFAGRLPEVQVHHGKADVIVPVSQAEAFIDAMNDAGRTAPGFQSYLYDGGEHSPLTLTGAFDRTHEFLAQLMP